MTRTPSIVSEAESVVRELATELTRVGGGECLCCYVDRLLDVVPCDCTQRHALRYRDQAAPRATALHERLGSVGAWCDCELFLNGYEPHERFWTPERELEEDGITFVVDAEPPAQMPPCAGVRRGSVRPCSNWVRIRRGFR